MFPGIYILINRLVKGLILKNTVCLKINLHQIFRAEVAHRHRVTLQKETAGLVKGRFFTADAKLLAHIGKAVPDKGVTFGVACPKGIVSQNNISRLVTAVGECPRPDRQSVCVEQTGRAVRGKQKYLAVRKQN